MDDTIFRRIFTLARELDDDSALAQIDALDDDGKKQVGELFLDIISADGLIDEDEADLFSRLKETCNLPASLGDSKAIKIIALDPETEEKEEDGRD